MPIITDSIGKVLGTRYRLVAPLGSGASAHVYLAEDVSLQRKVAVKVLQPALAREETFLKRFRAEARSVASLNHPHILRVFDWGEDADGPYLVLEYLHGGSLRDILDRGFRLSQAQAARLGEEGARALAYAHARGLVHRDVKPANLLFDEEGRVRIADFGVARALAEAAWTEPAGAMVGTARYASPEQAQGQPVDGRADVYALALVLYEALTGVVPFTADTTVGTLMARVGATLPRHPALGPLDDTLGRAAAPVRAHRLDAAALAARLEVVMSQLAPPRPLPLPTASDPGSSTLVQPPGSRTAGLESKAPTPPPPSSPPAPSPRAPAWTAPSPSPAPVFSADAAALAAPPPAPRRGGHRRRPVLVAGAALALVALVALVAGILVAVLSGAFTPSHPTPNVQGTTLAAARRSLTHDHFAVVVATPVYSVAVPAGSVVSQSPGPKASLKEGSTVSLVPSKGLPPVPVPSLSGLDCSSAARLLAEAHLKAACPVLQPYEKDIPTGQVVNWSYQAKLDPTRARYGSTIAIATSAGPPPVPVPTIHVGSSYDQAAGALQAVGLAATEAQQPSASVPAGDVIATDPPAGTGERPGSTITVIVSSGMPPVTVPDLGGDTVQQATSALQKLGLPVAGVEGPGGNKGHVFGSSPYSGEQVNPGTPVTLFTQ